MDLNNYYISKCCKKSIFYNNSIHRPTCSNCFELLKEKDIIKVNRKNTLPCKFPIMLY